MHESNPKGVLSSVPHKTGHVGTHLHLRGRGRIESLRSSSATHWVWSQLGLLRSRSCLIKIKTSHTTTTTKKRTRGLAKWFRGPKFNSQQSHWAAKNHLIWNCRRSTVVFWPVYTHVWTQTPIQISAKHCFG